jgi:hypothetical protein
MTLDEVPFVFFATAERRGPQYVRPPMLDVATMQIELYRFMSGEEQIYTVAGLADADGQRHGGADRWRQRRDGPGSRALRAGR